MPHKSVYLFVLFYFRFSHACCLAFVLLQERANMKHRFCAPSSTQRWCMLTNRYWLRRRWIWSMVPIVASCRPSSIQSLAPASILPLVPWKTCDVFTGCVSLFLGCLSALGMRCLNDSKFDWGKWLQFVFWTASTFPSDGGVALIIGGWKRILNKRCLKCFGAILRYTVPPHGFVFPSLFSQQSGYFTGCCSPIQVHATFGLFSCLLMLTLHSQDASHAE